MLHLARWKSICESREFSHDFPSRISGICALLHIVKRWWRLLNFILQLFLVDSRLTTTIEADFQTVFPVWWFSRVFIFLFTLRFLLSPFDSRVLLTLASFSDTCWREFVYHTHGSDASFHFFLIRRNIASRKSIPTFIIAPSASSSMKKTFVDIPAFSALSASPFMLAAALRSSPLECRKS